MSTFIWSQTNTVQNITRNGSYFSISGIIINKSGTTILNCIVKDISSNASACDLMGIRLSSSYQIVSNCVIDNLSGASNVYGIYTSQQSPEINKNYIKNLKTTSTSDNICGIYTQNSTNGGIISNNIIFLGYNAGSSLTNLKFHGIYVYDGASIYFNTVRGACTSD